MNSFNLGIGSKCINFLINVMKVENSLGLCEAMFRVQDKFNELDAKQTPEIRSTLRGDIFFKCSYFFYCMFLRQLFLFPSLFSSVFLMSGK